MPEYIHTYRVELDGTFRSDYPDFEDAFRDYASTLEEGDLRDKLLAPARDISELRASVFHQYTEEADDSDLYD